MNASAGPAVFPPAADPPGEECPGTLAAGLARYFSPVQLEKLGRVRIGVIGAGGLGSNVAMMLARSGVRCLTLADHDRVEASNLNRQAYFPTDVGHPKVDALARYLRVLEPAMDLRLHRERVTPENAAALFQGCGAVVEAVDDAGTKAMLYALFARSGCFYVTASGMGGLGCDPENTMRVRSPRPNVVCVGDFSSQVDAAHPPCAPGVIQAAALQAGAVLAFILK